jgi:hypothetical protein
LTPRTSLSGRTVEALGEDLDGRKAAAEPIVFIVSYHNVDYAKVACDHVLSFERDRLIDALAVESLCSGVTFIRDPHPDFDGGGGFSQANYAIKNQRPYWDLHLDFRPGSKDFGWTLFPNEAGMKSSGPMIDGEGSADKAAKQICTVVTGRGANIR